MNGTQLIQGIELVPASAAPDWKVRTVGHMNADAWVDLVWQHQTTRELSVWLMNGRTLTDGHYVTPSTNAAGWDIATTLPSWQVAAPVLNTPAGTYGAEQNLTATTHTSGATLRYSVDGSEPTVDSPVFPAPLAVTQSSTVKVKAFKSGYVPSRTLAAAYTLVAATPAMSHASGTYSTDLNVTLTSATPNAQIRYTLDGSEPSASSTLYTAPVAITANATLRTKAFRSGWSESTTSTATYGFQAAAPSFTPSPGSYGSGQTVSIATTTSGAMLRYTLSGSDPTERSEIYSAPLQMPPWVSTTLKAKAFRSNWTSSAVTSGAYQVGPQDTTSPAITAQVRPSPNAVGWNNADVTVTFDCSDTQSGVASCPAPITVTQETAGQLVSGTATDSAGNQASASVTVKIDKGAPTVAFSPAPPAETAGNSVAITGTVSDSFSGVASGSCNGQPASVSSGSLTCTVSLSRGRNPILVSVRDAAGNNHSTSALVRFGTATAPAATALIVSPERLTLPTGGGHLLQVADDYERVIENVAWSSSNENIATVSAEGLVTGVGAGAVNITATAGSLSRQVPVTVMAGAELVDGTVRWEVTATPGYTILQTITGMPDHSGSTYYVIEAVSPVGNRRVRVLGDDGEVKWWSPLPIASDEFPSGFGNSLGGVVLNVNGYQIVALGSDGMTGWQYRPAVGQVTALGQSGEGVIFAHETDGVSDSWITVLDGETGAVRGRVLLAPSSDWVVNNDCFAGVNFGWSRTGGFGGALAIDGAGTAHFFVSSADSFFDYLPCGAGSGSLSRRLELWSVSSTATKTVTVVAQAQSGSGGPPVPEYAPGTVVPADDDTILLNWWESEVPHLARKSNGGLNMLSSPPGGMGSAVMGEQSTLFARTWDGVAAIDVTTGVTRWTAAATSIVASTEGGGVAVQNGNTMVTYDSTGAMLSQSAADEQGSVGGTGGRIVTSGQGISHKVGEFIKWAAVYWLTVTGSPLAGYGPPQCTPPIFEKRPRTSLAFDYTFEFSSENGGFNPDQQLAFNAAAEAWKLAGYDKVLDEAQPKNTTIKYYRNTPFRPTLLGETVLRANLFRFDHQAVYAIPDAEFGVILTDQLVDETATVTDKFRWTAHHELGHLIGLGHSSQFCHRSYSIMTPSPPSPPLTTLGTRDSTAVTRLKLKRQ